MTDNKPQWYPQTHPFKPYCPDKAKGIIIGSAPPYRFCTDNPCNLKDGDIFYYYGSIYNRFWYAMKTVFEPNKLSWYRTASHCKNFLKDHDLAIADLFRKFNRKGKTASDNDLVIVEYNTGIIFSIMSIKKTICSIYFTSGFVFKEFQKMLKAQGCHFVLIDDNAVSITLRNDTKTFCYVVLPSPARQGPSDTVLLNGFKEAFMKICPH